MGDLALNTGVCGDKINFTSRKKKKMKFQMDGQFPLLPSAPAVTHEKTELLQLMIRDFMTVHYQLACGKEFTTTPWTSIAKHQSRLWDSEMWPSGVKVKDPSKIVLRDCLNIVTLWRQRQAHGGASHTFRFNFYINSEGLQPSIYVAFTPAVLPQIYVACTPAVSPQGDPTAAQILTPHAPQQMAESLAQLHISSAPSHGVEPRRQEGMHGMEEHHRRVHPKTPPGMPPDTGEVNVPTRRYSISVPRPLPAEDEVPSPDHPESDPPLRKGKQRKQYPTPSTGEESSDVSTDPGGRQGQRMKNLRLQRSLVNMSPEPTYENEEPLPPRVAKKSKRKLGRKTKSRRKAPPASRSGNDVDDGDICGDIAGGAVEQPLTAGRSDEPTLRSKIKPRPKPLKKQTRTDKPIDPETQAEQQEREDNLFILRKSGRAHKPKYNFAPPAQLLLERERETNKKKGNNP